MLCFQHWKISVVTLAARQQKIIFLTKNKKMRQDLKHSVEKSQQYSKICTVQLIPTRADITKAKYTTTDPANKRKVTTRGTTTGDTSIGIKFNDTYKKAEKI